MIEANQTTWTEVRRAAPTLEDCGFYHTVELPSGELARGKWDLRPTVDAYLGHFDFRDQSVLEVGPASGFLSFHMERAGATVTALEPPMKRLWDVVPMPDFDTETWRQDFTVRIERVRNSFWYLHHAHRSRVRVVESDPESLAPGVGDFDVGVLASVLLHCRSPISVLEGCARRVRKTIIVSELYDASLGELPVCHLLPRLREPQVDTWWALTPAFVVNALELMGFGEARINVHHQRRESDGLAVPMFTVVASRRAPRRRPGPGSLAAPAPPDTRARSDTSMTPTDHEGTAAEWVPASSSLGEISSSPASSLLSGTQHGLAEQTNDVSDPT